MDQCEREAHFRSLIPSFDAMSSGNPPTSAGQLLAESFEPAAAADAINAVLQNAPSVSASSGLEMQTEVELGDKDVVMEPKEDLPSPKSPEPEWEIAPLGAYSPHGGGWGGVDTSF